MVLEPLALQADENSHTHTHTQIMITIFVKFVHGMTFRMKLFKHFIVTLAVPIDVENMFTISLVASLSAGVHAKHLIISNSPSRNALPKMQTRQTDDFNAYLPSTKPH